MSDDLREHMPDENRIPKPLQCLEWLAMDIDTEFIDGSELLVAVPVMFDQKTCRWRYEIAVVQISCGEGYFDVSLNGDSWGWDISDVDFYVVIF